MHVLHPGLLVPRVLSVLAPPTSPRRRGRVGCDGRIGGNDVVASSPVAELSCGYVVGGGAEKKPQAKSSSPCSVRTCLLHTPTSYICVCASQPASQTPAHNIVDAGLNRSGPSCTTYKVPVGVAKW